MAPALVGVLARFERDRAAFAWAMADAARQEGNAAPMAQLGVVPLLLPLLSDPVPTVANTSAFALGRLAGHSAAVAAQMAQHGVIAQLVRGGFELRGGGWSARKPCCLGSGWVQRADLPCTLPLTHRPDRAHA